MRILDDLSDAPLKRILILLTPEEAKELRDGLEDLLLQPDSNHIHVPDHATYQKEITVAVYTSDPANLSAFGERYRRLIELDE